MNILMANWAWYPTGGDWTYIHSIIDIYKSQGHTIIPFSMHHDKNLYTIYNRYFVDNINYRDLSSKINLKSGYKIATKTIYSFEAKKKIELLLNENSVDIVQLNSITNSITPSIIPVIKKRKIPIVWRILDYKLICPNATLYRYDDAQTCEVCKKHKYYNCIIHKCKKQSLLASIVAAMGGYFYAIHPYYKDVDIFLFQSEFTRDMFVKFGYDVNRTKIIENPYDCSSVNKSNSAEENYILYFGRLDKEKGVMTLIEAMKTILDIELKIIGNGDEYKNCMDYIKINHLKNVSLLGPKWGKELELILKDCRFVVVPSEWHEPSPYVVLQAFSHCKPVIASNMGGLNDLITSDVNGLFFNAGNSIDLTSKINDLWRHPEKIQILGNNARKMVETIHNPQRYYDFTMQLFSELINKNSL
ncbi:glycosyl transferase [Bacteroidia bacterium]|nr:glycosyl transferase [Bacteroidia bacterium]